MNRAGVALAHALALIAIALPAAASDDSHAGGASSLIWPALNLLLLLGVLVYFARKPVAGYFSTRRTGIAQALDGAASELSNAEAIYAKWQRRLIDLETELDEIRATSKRRAESEREKILADARVAAERIRREALSAVDQELRRAREQLREEATQLAIGMAADRLGREINDADRDRLLDEFIDRIGSGDANATAREA